VLVAVALVVAGVAVVVLLAGCGGDDEKTASSTPTATAETPTPSPTPEPTEAEVGKDCADVGDLDGEPKRKPPADVSVPAYAHVYKSTGPSGEKTRFYAVLDGTPDDLASRRDDAQNQLVQNQGYQSLSTDQEEGSEATAHLQGPEHTVDIQVAPLCEAKIRIRYTVSAVPSR
jgi:hypothetical protein